MRFPALFFALLIFIVGHASLSTYAQTNPPAADSPVAKPRSRTSNATSRYKWVNPLYKEERQHLDSLKPTWNIVSVHLMQMLVREVQISYERFVSRRLSLEAAGGIRIPNFDDNEVYSGLFAQDYDLNYKAYPFIRSYYGALGIKWSPVTLNERPSVPLYVAVIPFYRYNFFDRRGYSILSGSSLSTYAYEQSKDQRIPGLKVLVGVRLPAWHVDARHKFLLDLFAGAGVRRIFTTTTTYGMAAGTDDLSRIIFYPEPKTEKSSKSISSLQMGAKLSFAWAK